MDGGGDGANRPDPEPGKTTIRQAWQDSFDFLGYTFGVLRNWRNGWPYLGARPSRKSVQRLRERVYALLRPCEVGTWEEVRDRLNALLKGWRAYFSYGTLFRVYRRRTRTCTSGCGRFSGAATRRPTPARQAGIPTQSCTEDWACSGSRGIVRGRLREPIVKSVGMPDAEDRHVRFDERGRETGRVAPRPPSTLLGRSGAPDLTDEHKKRLNKPKPRSGQEGAGPPVQGAFSAERTHHPAWAGDRETEHKKRTNKPKPVEAGGADRRPGT